MCSARLAAFFDAPRCLTLIPHYDEVNNEPSSEAESAGAGMTVEERNHPGRREGVQVIARAAEMLRYLAAEPAGLTLAGLTAHSQLPPSTVHRLVSALVAEGFVRQAPSGRLRIGPALIGLALSSRSDLRHEVGPHLERLSHRLRETVDLGVIDAGEVLFIDQYTARRTLRIVSQIGARFPLHATANGKALLAALSAEEARALLPQRLAAFTKNTITNRTALLRELEEVRASELAYDHEEYTLGIAAVATAVRDAVGALASVGVVVPLARFSDQADEITRALVATRDELQAILSGD